MLLPPALSTDPNSGPQACVIGRSIEKTSLKINQLNKPMEKCSASLVTKEIRFKPLQVTASCLEK